MRKKKILIILGVVLLLSSIFAFSVDKYGKTVNIYHANPIKITVKKKISLPTREFTLFYNNGQKIPFIVNILDEKNYIVVPLQREASSVLYIKNPSNVTSISEYTGDIFVQTKANFFKLKEANQNLYSIGFGAKSSPPVVYEEYTETADLSAKSAPNTAESKTNVQVKGVDEADIVKVFGNNIFYAKDYNIHIVTVNNGKFVGQSLLKLDDGFTIREMYVDKTRLVAIGTSYKNFKDYSTAIVYDISNLNAPKKYRTLSQEGEYVSSRKINNDIYLITENRFGSGFNVPIYMDSAVSSEYKEIDLKELRFFPPYNPNSMVAISSFSTMNKDASTVASFLGSADNIYMNKKNLFVSYVDYYNEPLPIKPVPYVEGKKSSTDDEEVIDITSDDYYAPKTIIKKFSIKNGKFTYIGEAKIVGTLINQFAMDESNGYFRVAYTRGFEKGSEVAVFDKNMKQAGLLQAIAPTERIYSARFIGDRLYLVTFKETDPFFVIDLKNPKKPNVLGYLKIPGFSNYLHPYDDSHIIGFGNATQETNYNATVTNGMKIAMFDVSDVQNPKQISNVEIGNYGTYSELMYNHKALMYNAEKKYFGFPIRVTEKRKGAMSNDVWDVQTVFVGGFVYEVTSDFKLNFKGKTTHSDSIGGTSMYDYDHYTEVRRLVYIGDYIYSISDKLISSNKASDMSFVQKVAWDYR